MNNLIAFLGGVAVGVLLPVALLAAFLIAIDAENEKERKELEKLRR